MKKICEIEGCTNEVRARGLCGKHYERRRQYGSPHILHRVGKTLHERLSSGSCPQDPATGCIEWGGCMNKDNYGVLTREGKICYTHRLAWELKRGPIPPGMHVLHRCDNPPCCNPDHLFLGTHLDNMRDRDAKGRCKIGRRARGEAHCHSKLTESGVVEIRKRIAKGDSNKEIAADFGVSGPLIRCIKLGKIWKHVPQ